jgi:hypothetical protein
VIEYRLAGVLSSAIGTGTLLRGLHSITYPDRQYQLIAQRPVFAPTRFPYNYGPNAIAPIFPRFATGDGEPDLGPLIMRGEFQEISTDAARIAARALFQAVEACLEVHQNDLGPPARALWMPVLGVKYIRPVVHPSGLTFRVQYEFALEVYTDGWCDLADYKGNWFPF